MPMAGNVSLLKKPDPGRYFWPNSRSDRHSVKRLQAKIFFGTFRSLTGPAVRLGGRSFETVKELLRQPPLFGAHATLWFVHRTTFLDFIVHRTI
jgi:hypothetical protein